MKHQINPLTSTRAIAAIFVVIHHFGHDVYPFSKFAKFFHNGNVSVSYFFVLSGFVLYITYKDKHIQYSDYLKRRIGRIVPVYLLALFLFICVVHHFPGYSFSHDSIIEIIISGLFLQAFIPHYPLTLNLPAWTISVEMFFYMLFPLFLLFQKRHIKGFIGTTVVLYVLSQSFHLWSIPIKGSLGDNVIDTLFFNPVIHINQFLIGMVGGYLFGKVSAPSPKYAWLSFLSFILIILLIAFRPDNISYQVGLIAPVFMIFILSIAASDPKFLNFKPLVFLGEISYGIYILQFPVYYFLAFVNSKYTGIPDTYFFYIALCMLILAASLSYLVFEKPLRDRINLIHQKR